MGESTGIEKKNRNYLDIINRTFTGPFTLNEVSSTLNLDYKKTKRFAAYLASRGWLARVKNGYYKAVPLGTLDPFGLKEEPWVLASKIYEPCYIGGFSACGYWDLTEQIFKDTVVFTQRKITGRAMPGYVVRTIAGGRMFGSLTAWVNNIKINVSDPSRTVVDMLNEPALGGGIRNAADMIGEYFLSGHRNDALLLEYLEKFGNRVLYKRLGYLCESMGIAAPEIIAGCLKKISKGYTVLDPSIKTKGNYDSRWNLLVNSSVKNETK